MSVDRGRPNRFGSRLTLAVAALLAVGLGSAVGVGLQAVLAVVGAFGLSWGLWSATAAPRRRALVSVASVCGLGMLALGVGYTHPPGQTAVVAAGGLAVVTLGVSLAPRPATDARFGAVLQTSVLTLVVVACLSLLARPATVRFTRDLLVGLFDIVTTTVFVALVAIELVALALLVLLPPTMRVLDGWLPNRDAVPPRHLASTGLSFEDIRAAPRWLAIVFVGQLYLVLLAPRLLDWVVDQLSVLGTALSLVLQSGAVFALLFGACLLCSFVLAGRALQRFVVGVAGEDPTGTAADAAGAVVAPVVGGVLLYLLPSSTTAPVVPLANGFGTIGLVAVALVIALLGVFVAWDVLVVSAGPGGPPLVSGYSVAAGLLGVAVLFAADLGAAAFVVFVGFVGVVLVWDGGEYATTLGRELPTADGREGVLAHGTASALVGVGAVVVAMLTAYVVGPAATIPADAGTVALALALVAIVALVVAETR
ncbi:hypothetical protein [Halomarina rubra]|uniref:Uncharacterized protein n=1 Tax=Halomarina rubra TaxID=2071873 RepID=A0ABD6ASY3_9EURY|nr:hypothetical protein [Halomarina rubra]